MIALLLALLAAAPCPYPHRSRAVAAKFRRLHPCPGGPDKGSTERCAGYVIDHHCALGCGGPDATSNMRWMSTAAAKKKDRTELNCKTCPPGTTCPMNEVAGSEGHVLLPTDPPASKRRAGTIHVPQSERDVQ